MIIVAKLRYVQAVHYTFGEYNRFIGLEETRKGYLVRQPKCSMKEFVQSY